jgi:signal transduction histidine kinase
MQGRHSLVGVIYLDVSTSPQQVLQSGATPKFNEEHLRLLIAIAHQAALAVEETRHYAAMVQAERLAAVGQAIACLSHHVKNILQGIRGGSYLLKEGISTHNPEMVAKGWEFVEKNQERISHLVMDMLTFSKEREPEMHPADINTVAGDVCELMQSRAAELGVTLAFEPMTPIPKLTFDPEGLHRAILNVVSNAIDACDPRNRRDEPEVEEDFEDDAASIFSESSAAETVESVPVAGGPGPGSKGPGFKGTDSKGPGSKGSGSKGPGSKTGGSGAKSTPHVEVRTVYDPVRSVVQVVVDDNGGGIPPDALEHIFSLFVSNKGSRGTGLGLPVSQKIMKEHGGRIDVESEWGRGARFTLEMPAVPVDATRDLEAFKEAGENAAGGSGLGKPSGGSGTGSGVAKEAGLSKEAGGSGTGTVA